MSKHVKHVPKHRQVKEPLVAHAPRKALRTSMVLSSLAVAATGVAVGGGVLATGPTGVAATAASTVRDAAPDTDPAPVSAARLEDRLAPVSRSADRRDRSDPAKKAALSALSSKGSPAITRTEDSSDQDPRSIGRTLLSEFGYSADQFSCLDSLWTRESGWNVSADNPSSSAYGIPQSLPGSKMASAGADWATNPVTQIRWGLGYIRDSYGSPCSAWGHSQAVGWY